MDVHRFRAFSGIFGCFRALFGQTGTNGEFILMLAPYSQSQFLHGGFKDVIACQTRL